MDYYIVICRDDRLDEFAAPGDYILATRQIFATATDAEDYAKTIARGREPLIVEGRWGELRQPGERYREGKENA